jgi:hypothetical protein
VGLASNIVFKNIFVKNVTFPIYVTQKWVWVSLDPPFCKINVFHDHDSYFDQSQAPPPPSTTSVTIQGMSFTNFIGTINSHHPGKPCMSKFFGIKYL